jgi:hypothetical protein
VLETIKESQLDLYSFSRLCCWNGVRNSRSVRPDPPPRKLLLPSSSGSDVLRFAGLGT